MPRGQRGVIFPTPRRPLYDHHAVSTGNIAANNYLGLIGLCLDKSDLVEIALVRKPGVDLGLFDELSF